MFLINCLVGQKLIYGKMMEKVISSPSFPFLLSIFLQALTFDDFSVYHTILMNPYKAPYPLHGVS